jgi:CRP/FNR family cyclic AMP-dependent transcriptional regulator
MPGGVLLHRQGDASRTWSKTMSDPDILQGLRDSQLAAELDSADLPALAAELTRHDLAEGDVVVAEGTADDHLYLVVSGALGVIKNLGTPQEEKLSVVMAGGLAGELAFIDGAIRYASLVALRPTRLLGLERARFETLIDAHPHLVYHVMRGIVRVVHEIQRQQSMQSAELANYVYKVHGRY